IWPGNSCNVEIRFQPGELGEKSGSLALEIIGEGTLEVPLSGSGSTGTLSANPSSLNFSAIPYTRSEHEENQNENEQVNIEAQTAGVQVESVSITGPDASSFSVQYGNCNSNQLPENNWCNAGIRFQPLSPGEKHAQLVIKSDAQSGTLVVPLEGEGLNGPKVELSSNGALLGDVLIGSAVEHTFTVANGGDYPLFIQQSFAVSGTPQMFQMFSDTCSGQIIEPGSSCVYTVSFQPTTPGEKDSSIVFITNASPQINVLGVDGVGVQPAATSPTPVTPAATTPVAPATVPAPASKRDAISQQHLLSFEQVSHLHSSVDNGAVETGVNAECPAKVSVCQTESFITARVLSHPSSATSQNVARTTVLLGSDLAQLHGGQRAAVSIPLSSRARALLKRHGHLRVTIETVIRGDGKIIAERTRTVKLIA
ncbi:MAG: choice-of-anchor D domain-containing protein, partial [Solirubrobacteraceae bacterium]